MKISVLFFGLFLTALVGRPIAVDVPELRTPVTDEYGLLAADERTALDIKLSQLAKSNRLQMAIYIPKTLQDFDIESFSMAVAEKWKLGKKGQDQGLLLIVAPAERKMRFEVGYGLEGDITDAVSRRLLDNILRPKFREQKFAEGLTQVIDQITIKLKITEGESALDSTKPTDGKVLPLPIWVVLIFLLFFVLVIRALTAPRGSSVHRRRSWWDDSGWGGGGFGGGGGSWGGGSSGGGSFGGGGGGFGGGGSSSSW